MRMRQVARWAGGLARLLEQCVFSPLSANALGQQVGCQAPPIDLIVVCFTVRAPLACLVRVLHARARGLFAGWKGVDAGLDGVAWASLQFYPWGNTSCTLQFPRASGE
eukprot:18966-Pyramimonas_sp.AAC.1